MQVKVPSNATWASVFLFLVVIFMWFGGAVLAKGFWSTLFAIFIPPWAFYLTVERLLVIMGWV